MLPADVSDEPALSAAIDAAAEAFGGLDVVVSNAGIEVASVTPLAPGGKGVVVGEIEAIERELGVGHGGYPLFLCRVSTGRERYAVV